MALRGRLAYTAIVPWMRSGMINSLAASAQKISVMLPVQLKYWG
jgi:hypothetical protein